MTSLFYVQFMLKAHKTWTTGTGSSEVDRRKKIWPQKNIVCWDNFHNSVQISKTQVELSSLVESGNDIIVLTINQQFDSARLVAFVTPKATITSEIQEAEVSYFLTLDEENCFQIYLSSVNYRIKNLNESPKSTSSFKECWWWWNPTNWIFVA